MMGFTFVLFAVFLIGSELIPCFAEQSYQRTKADCEKRLKVGSRCQQRKERQKWFYNATSETCEQFTYLGCGGNANRFPSEQACLRTCRPEAIQKTPSVAEQGESCEQTDGSMDTDLPTDLCTETPDKGGRCDRRPPGLRWFYVPENKTCSQFFYCGCGGNGNNFPEEDACIQACDPLTYDYEETESNIDETKNAKS
uniref:BPTI/Kunitz inhibitor domain-containing protein n=1 Tax=Amblyomma maculatum TaxID=34609 RepID=G3MKU8_AMBMU